MHEPKLHAWVAEDVPAKAFYPESPGRWVAEADWPPAGLSAKRLHLQPGKLEDEPGPEQPVTTTTPQTLGLKAGELMPWYLPGLAAALPGDQRADDGKYLRLDSQSLTEPRENLGAPGRYERRHVWREG